MKKFKFIQTLINIWSIEELRNKILFTLMMIAVYRLGAHIVLPGIDATQLKTGANNSGILGLIDSFSGGAFNNASIFALGIMPYISASIFMQLMTVLVPRFQKMQKEGDSGRKKITQYTRYLTVGVTILQASAYVTYLRGMTSQTGGMMAGYSAANFWLTTVVILTAGTLFVMWMGEKITDKGLGNGTSLIIMIGIVARLPQNFLQELTAKSNRSGDILVFIVEIAILIAIGWLIHLPFYIPVKSYIWKRTVKNDHYDSVMMGVLIFTYPVYLVIITSILWITLECWWVIFLLLLAPFTAWAYVQLKPQLDK